MNTACFERDWANALPKDILHKILDKLLEPRDHANFSIVCHDWHLARKDYSRKQPLLPMLMIPTRLDDDDQETFSRTERSLYSISTGKIYDIPGLSVLDKLRYCGSSHSWLATVEEKTTIVLVNPFRNALTIRLPPLDFVPTGIADEYNIYKVILTADPISNPNNYVVVAIYSAGMRLALYKSGQNSWTYIYQSVSVICDVIIYKGLAYATNNFGNDIISFDVNSSSEPWGLKQFKSKKPTYLDCNSSHYLVASSQGKLLQVQRSFDMRYTNVTESFEVFKLQLEQEKGEGVVEKVAVKSLGKDAIFVGQNYSVAIFIDSLSCKFRLCQPNSIYYTGEFCEFSTLYIYEHHKDVGCFNFEDKTFQPYYKSHPCHEWNKQMSRPLWITPLLLL